MEVVTLPDGRVAEVVSRSGKFLNIQFADGRTVVYPIDKLVTEEKDDPEFNMVVIPAIERLEELQADLKRLNEAGINLLDRGEFEKLRDKLSQEAINDFANKWGLI